MAAFAGPGPGTVSRRNSSAAGYHGRRALPCAFTTAPSRPRRWPPPAWPIMPPIWKTRSRRLDDAAHPGRPFDGRPAGADAGGAHARSRAAVLLAPSAPWGVPPSTLFEIGAAQAMMLQRRLLEHGAGAQSRHRRRPFAGPLSQGTARRSVRPLVPESGRATFEILHWGLDMNRASEVDAARCTCPLAVSDRQRRPHQSARHGGAHRGALQGPRAPTKCCPA